MLENLSFSRLRACLFFGSFFSTLEVSYNLVGLDVCPSVSVCLAGHSP